MKCSEVFRKLKRNGWYVVSQSGSHIKLKHDLIDGIVIFPNHGSKEIAKGLLIKIAKKSKIKF